MFKNYLEVSFKKLTPALLTLVILAKILGQGDTSIASRIMSLLLRNNVTIDDIKQWFNFNELSDTQKQLLFERLKTYLETAEQGSGINFSLTEDASSMGSKPGEPFDIEPDNLDIHDNSNFDWDKIRPWFKFKSEFNIPLLQDKQITEQLYSTAAGFVNFQPGDTCQVSATLDMSTLVGAFGRRPAGFTEEIDLIIPGTLEDGRQASLKQRHLVNTQTNPELFVTVITSYLVITELDGTTTEAKLSNFRPDIPTTYSACDFSNIEISYQKLLQPVADMLNEEG